MKREDISVGQRLVVSYQTHWKYITVDYIGNEQFFGTITYGDPVLKESQYAVRFDDCSPYKGDAAVEILCADKLAKIREILDA
ncbi:MAG: hypothetical protein KKF62_19360 [Bacteroidetes bacterium]|nr:hypothetical protein [Bacteroidota bacterium]